MTTRRVQKGRVFPLTENFTGNEAYSRPFRSHIIPGSRFYEGLWREPAPFDLSSGYGLAMGHYGGYGWLSSPGGVWRAPLDEQTLYVSADVINVRQESGSSKGSLTVELRNDDGRYAAPGQGVLAALGKGCRLEFSPGYLTAEGAEYSDGLCYAIESCEHTSAGGKATLVIHARDGWGALDDLHAGYQLRWNGNSSDFSVKDIIAVILAKAGLGLAVKTQSAAITGFYPDFTVNPGGSGREAVQKLLSLVPDVIFIEGDTAYVVNPQSADTAVYGYGSGHPVLEGKYRQSAMEINRVQAEGWDAGAGGMILVDGFSWAEIDIFGERLKHVADRNLNTAAEAAERAAALLRSAEMDSENSLITVPVNCGQQLFDVVAVTDARAGLDAAVKRVTGITLVYSPDRGEYFQRLKLGKV